MLYKHSLLAVVFLLGGMLCIGQQKPNLKIHGKLKFASSSPKMLELTFRKIGGGYQFDSCKVINGEFFYEKEIVEPTITILSMKPDPGSSNRNGGSMDYLPLFLMPGEVLINATDSLKSAVVTGSGAKANSDYKALSNKLNLYIDTVNRINRLSRSSGLSAEETEKRAIAVNDSINLLRDEYVYLKTFKANINSPVAAFALLSYAGEPVWTPRKKMFPEEIEKLLNTLPQHIKNYKSIVNLKEELAIAKATGKGKPIIDFALTDTAGKTVRLSDFKGRYVFLDFWASWCLPCRKENPNVKAQFEKYKNKGFTVLSVSIDKPEDKQKWLDAITNDQIGIWTQLADPAGRVAADYYVKSIPTNFVIGPDGKFIDRNLYGENLNKALAALFEK